MQLVIFTSNFNTRFQWLYIFQYLSSKGLKFIIKRTTTMQSTLKSNLLAVQMFRQFLGTNWKCRCKSCQHIRILHKIDIFVPQGSQKFLCFYCVFKANRFETFSLKFRHFCNNTFYLYFIIWVVQINSHFIYLFNKKLHLYSLSCHNFLITFISKGFIFRYKLLHIFNILIFIIYPLRYNHHLKRLQRLTKIILSILGYQAY